MAHADRIPHDRRAGQHPKQVHHLNPLICSRIRHLASAKRPADPVRKFVLCVGGKFTVHTNLSTFWHQNAAPSSQPPTPPSPQTASRSSPPPRFIAPSISRTTTGRMSVLTLRGPGIPTRHQFWALFASLVQSFFDEPCFNSLARPRCFAQKRKTGLYARIDLKTTD